MSGLKPVSGLAWSPQHLVECQVLIPSFDLVGKPTLGSKAVFLPGTMASGFIETSYQIQVPSLHWGPRESTPVRWDRKIQGRTKEGPCCWHWHHQSLPIVGSPIGGCAIGLLIMSWFLLLPEEMQGREKTMRHEVHIISTTHGIHCIWRNL